MVVLSTWRMKRKPRSALLFLYKKILAVTGLLPGL